jgi:hypothetical protein
VSPGPGRGRVIALILGAQTVANVGPLGIPAVASLLRADLGLTLAQAGSFLSAYYIGPALISLPAQHGGGAGRPRARARASPAERRVNKGVGRDVLPGESGTRGPAETIPQPFTGGALR